MEIVKHTINEFMDEASIVIISDLHIGHRSHLKEQFEKAIDEIAIMNPELVIVNGDLIDGITIKDKRFTPKAMHPDFADFDNIDDIIIRQCDVAIEYLEQLQRLGIKVYVLEGNHEESIRKYTSVFSPYNYICNKLETQKIGYYGYFDIAFGNQRYGIVAQHGSGGGGTTAGYPANKVSKLAQTFDCDLYTIGHIHRSSVNDVEKYKYNVETNERERVRTWLGTTGCFLDTSSIGSDDYFARQATSLSDIGYLVFNVKRDSHESTLYERKL